MPISEKYLCRFEEGGYYHIYNRCPSLRKMFTRHGDYKFFLNRVEKYLTDYADIYAYCLIPNHFHFFIRVKTRVELPVKKNIHKTLVNQFRRLFISHSRMVNTCGNAHGQLFCTPFKRIEIHNDAYFTQIIYYIHHNPVHHQISHAPASYTYSSYQAYLSSNPSLVKKEVVLDWFGGADPFVKYHKVHLEELEKLPFHFE